MTGTFYFFTGLAGAGKSTIGGLFYRRLKAQGADVVLVDGDQSRAINQDRDYSTEARRRGAFAQFRRCKALTEQGRDVVLCSICMYRDVRAWGRANIEHYREIYVKASMETLYRRDQKGLYTKVRKNVVGLDLPWDEPDSPDVVISNDGLYTPEEIADVLEVQLGLIPQEVRI